MVTAMRNVIVTLVLLLALSASDATAKDDLPKIDGSIRSTLDVYDKFLVPEDRKGIESFIGGMQIGLLWANVVLKERGQPLLYCQPDKLVITDSQMIDMMRRAMNDNPKWGDFPLGMMVLVTLQRTFPCKE
jgi:hypothetical protein